VAAIKYRGINAVTNFDITRYDVDKIIESNMLLPADQVRRNNRTANAARRGLGRQTRIIIGTGSGCQLHGGHLGDAAGGCRVVRRAAVASSTRTLCPWTPLGHTPQRQHAHAERVVVAGGPDLEQLQLQGAEC